MLSALRAEMRSYLDRGYTVVKMKIGGEPIAEDRRRIEAVLEEIGSDAQLAVDANGRFDLETAIAYAKMLRDYPLFWYEEAGDPLDYQLQAALAEFYPGADGDRREPVQPPGRAQPDPLWRHAAGSRLAAVRLRAVLRAVRIPAHAGDAEGRTAGRRRRCIPHGGHQMSLNIAAGLGLGGNESYPGPVPALWRLPRRRRAWRTAIITLPDLPGIGFEGKSDLYAQMRRTGGVANWKHFSANYMPTNRRPPPRKSKNSGRNQTGLP